MVPKGLLPDALDPVVVGSGHLGRGKQSFARSFTVSMAGRTCGRLGVAIRCPDVGLSARSRRRASEAHRSRRDTCPVARSGRSFEGSPDPRCPINADHGLTGAALNAEHGDVHLGPMDDRRVNQGMAPVNPYARVYAGWKTEKMESGAAPVVLRRSERRLRNGSPKRRKPRSSSVALGDGKRPGMAESQARLGWFGRVTLCRPVLRRPGRAVLRTARPGRSPPDSGSGNGDV